MIQVEFSKMAPGTCCWCGKERDEVITVSFSDKSFSGPMCFADFRKALRMKVHKPELKPEMKTVITQINNGGAGK